MTTPPPDEVYLTTYAREQQADSSPSKFPTCPRCGHQWHGVACTALVAGSHVSTPCACPSSWEAAA